MASKKTILAVKFIQTPKVGVIDAEIDLRIPEHKAKYSLELQTNGAVEVIRTKTPDIIYRFPASSVLYTVLIAEEQQSK